MRIGATAVATIWIASQIHAATVPLPVAEILARALAVEKALDIERAHYIYREHVDNRQPNSKIRHTNDYDVIYLEGQSYQRLVAINGKPLTGKRAVEEERRFQMTRAERKAADALRKPDLQVVHAGLELERVIRLMTHTLTGEELIGGRAAWVIKSEPPTAQPLESISGKDRETLCYRSTLWIDKEDFAIAQLHWEVLRKGPEVLPGSYVTRTFQRMAPGLWVLDALTGEFFAGPPHPKDHWKQTHRFTDYHKFGSESNVSFDLPDTKGPN